MNVLMAENEVTTRRMLDGVWTRAGHDVAAAENGADACEPLKDGCHMPAAPDLMMPDRAGGQPADADW